MVLWIKNTTGCRKRCYGKIVQCLKNTEGICNTALGHIAMYDNTTGDNNVAVGADALTNNTTADDNTAVWNECFKKQTQQVILIQQLV